MKRWLFFALAFIAFSQVRAQDIIPNYNFKFKIAGLKDTSVYLGYHMGEKKYVSDTAHVNSKGECSFSGNDTLTGGIYLFVLPNKRYFEFVVNAKENNFTIQSDTNDFYTNMVVTGSPENELWATYLRYTMLMHGKSEEVTNQMKGLDSNGNEFKKLQKSLDELDKELLDYRLKLINDNNGMLVAKLINGLREPEVPDAPKELDDTGKKTWQYMYFRSHYWDFTDFSDGRLVRTPGQVLEGKLKYYFDKIVPQVPDTMIAELDQVIAKTTGSEEMRRYVTLHLTYAIANSQVMCMDRAFVHMVDKYFKFGDGSKWLGAKDLEKLYERADKLRPLLCGEIIPNLILQDTTESTWHNLHRMPQDYIVVYFFDANCSHCKKSTPDLQALYETYLDSAGIGIYGVEGNLETTDWKKFLNEKGIKFLTVSDNPELNKNAYKYLQEGKTTLESLNFRQTFDLFSYPVIYLIDKERKIIAKKLGVEQIKEFFENWFKTHPRSSQGGTPGNQDPNHHDHSDPNHHH